MEQGAGTSGGGWRAAVVGAVQVGGASHRERRWGTGEIERFLKRNGYGWGGGRKEGEITIQTPGEEKGGAES